VLGQPLVLGLAAAVLLLALFWFAVRRRRARGAYDADDKIPPTFMSRAPLPPGGGAQASATGAGAATASPKAADTRSALASSSVPPATTPTRARSPASDNDLDFDLAPGAAAPGRPAPVSSSAAAVTKPDTVPAAAAQPTLAGPSLVREPAHPAAPTLVAGAAGAASSASAAADARPAPSPAQPQDTQARTPVTPPDAGASAVRPGPDSKPSNLLDFDLDSAPPARPTLDALGSERVSSEPPPRDFEFKLDLDNLDLAAPGEAKEPAPPRDAHWYDVQQKFDLAKAYEEMGDREGARDILREVLKEGDQEQRVQATQVLAKLG
jgi:pilus assembly protein FimV